MEKYSVKKPFTVLVAVLIVFLLGFVSVTNLRTDLLPEISTPYLMVVTVYPGASPEKVETEVSEVLESALGTVAGVSSITSTSAENYSIVQLSFAADTQHPGPERRQPARHLPDPLHPGAEHGHELPDDGGGGPGRRRYL